MKSKLHIALLSLFLAIIAIKIFPFIWLGIAITLFILLFLIIDEKYFISFSIILFLILTSDLTVKYRNYINVLLTLLLSYLYLKNFGLYSKILHQLPNEIKSFVSLTIISMLLSSLFSDNISYALIITLRQLVFFSIIFILFSFIKDKNSIFSYINSLIMVSIILGLGIIYEIISKGLTLFSISTNSFTQFSGLYSNPNEVGLLLNISIPMLIGVVIIKRSEQNKFKYFYFTTLAFLFSILFLTDSRASIGAVLISTIFILWRLKSKYLKYLSFSSATLILLIIIVPVLNEYAGFYFRIGRIFENTRFYIWAMSLDMIKHNFFFGVGPDLFESKIYTYLPVMLGTFAEHQIRLAGSGTSHNFFLYKFAEGGILGFATAIYLFFIFFKISFITEKKMKNINKDYYLLSVAISSIGVGLFFRDMLESTGVLTNGWITRDLPFWLVFIIIIYFYQSLIGTEKKLEIISAKTNDRKVE